MAVPTVTSITPNVGPTGGRTLVRIKGTGFQLPPPPAPMRAGQTTPSPNPSVEVLFGVRKAREVRVLSSELLHVVSPISDPGAFGVTVRNLKQDGTVVPGETVTVANGYTFGRPDTARKPSDEVTLQRVVRHLLRELKRQVIENVELTTHTDYDDSPSGANVAALASLPGLVLAGPRLIENRLKSTNQARRKTQASGSDLKLYPPRTYDLEFTLIGVDELQGPMLALMHECTMFFTRNIVLNVPVSAAQPLGEQVEYDMDLTADGHFASIGSPGNSNIRAFSGTFRVQGVDFDDDDMAALEAFPVSDMSRSGGILNVPSPMIWMGQEAGPAGIVTAPPIPSGPTSPSPGLQDGVQQIPPPEEE